MRQRAEADKFISCPNDQYVGRMKEILSRAEWPGSEAL